MEKRIKRIFAASGGIAHTSQLVENGIHRVYLTRMVAEGKIARLRRGVYEWVEDGGQSDVVNLRRLLPDAIICLDSALDYYGYIDRTPASWHIALNKNHSRWKAKLNYPPVTVHYVPTHLLTLGRTRATIDGTEMWIYDRERTICDVLRYQVDPEVRKQSIRSYAEDPERHPTNLLEYAGPLRVKRRIQEQVALWL